MGTSPPSCFLRLDTLTKFRSPWGYTRALSSQVSRYYHSWSDFPHWLDDGINPLLLNDDSKKFTPLLATMLDAIPTICGSLQPSNLRIDIPRSCLEESLVDRETLSSIIFLSLLLFPSSQERKIYTESNHEDNHPGEGWNIYRPIFFSPLFDSVLLVASGMLARFYILLTTTGRLINRQQFKQSAVCDITLSLSAPFLDWKPRLLLRRPTVWISRAFSPPARSTYTGIDFTFVYVYIYIRIYISLTACTTVAFRAILSTKAEPANNYA